VTFFVQLLQFGPHPLTAAHFTGRMPFMLPNL